MGTLYISSRFPPPHVAGTAADTVVSFDILGSNVSGVSVDIVGEQVFDGYLISFLYPYATSSTITPITYGIYDGYHFEIYRDGGFDDGIVDVVVSAVDSDGSDAFKWTFLVGDSLNTLYFCDGYGIKKIEINKLVGECQSKVRTILSSTTSPSIKDNITFIHSNKVDEYYYLALSNTSSSLSIIGLFYWGIGTLGSVAGAYIIKNEVDAYSYSSDFFTEKAQINNRGILYLINKTSNQIDVYYGANRRDGVLRTPDFSYSSSSTPAIIGGTILDLYIIDDASVKYSGGTRLFVGTTLGMTRIEAYDKESVPGSPGGYDNLGLAVNYGIVGSGAQYEILGGTIPSVSKIASDSTENIIFVITSDGYGDGGLTQMSLSGNRRMLYMSVANGLLPSSDLRDVFAKG